jgi:hypothetical protein
MSLKDGALYKGYMELQTIPAVQSIKSMSGQDWGIAIASGLLLWLVWTYPWEDSGDDDDNTPDQPMYI